jgi:biotin transport system substrate-specific component
MNADETVKTISLKNVFRKIAENKLVWVISFSILTAIAAQITIPAKPVPFTLQTTAVLLSGAFLGAKRGAYSQLIYLGLGIIGLPVFAQIPDGAYGFMRLFGPTGGYLLAFPLAAFITGFLVELNKSYAVVVTSMFLGALIILFIGAMYLHFIFIKDFAEAIKAGAAIFSIWTVIKVFAAATIYFGIEKGIKKNSKS